MAYDNRQLVHVWAQQNKDSGRNGRGDSLHFSGRSLFSYRTEIARFIDGRAVYTTHRYSVTTTGKHAIHIPAAVRHVENYSTPRELRDIPDQWDAAAPILFGDMLRALKGEIETILRSRSRVEWLIERFAENAADAWTFYGRYIADRYIADPSIVPVSPDHLTIRDLSNLTSNVAGFSTADALRDLFGADVQAKIERERAAQRERREQDKARAAARLVELQKAISEWRAGKNNRSFYDVPAMLRVSADGTEIETSRGARVPVAGAIMLWRAIQAGADIIGQQIGAFTVRSLTSDCLTIGCHDLPMEEVRAIARALNLPGADVSHAIN